GQVQALIAQATAEIERQKARVLQVRRQLDADVVQPAEADRQAREEAARGEAAVMVERGKAEAEALQKVCAAYAAAGPGAREVMALQQVLPLLADVAGSERPLAVSKVAVLPPDHGDGGLARAAIRTAEQIKAGTGVAAAGEKVRGAAARSRGRRPGPGRHPHRRADQGRDRRRPGGAGAAPAEGGA